MKRYAFGSRAVNQPNGMFPDPTGDYIRHDDADLAALVAATERLVSVINAAGLVNLSNGVQLGATSWYCKATAAMERTTAALSALAAAASGTTTRGGGE